MQQEERALQVRQDKPRRIKALQPQEQLVEGVEPQVLTTTTVLLSLHDVAIECKGETINAHSVALRLSAYFTTILDDVDLDKSKRIPLPDTFDPSQVREFVCALYNCLNVDSGLLEKSLSARNVVSLTELAHYFDAPILHTACDKALALNHTQWFPNQLLLLTQFSATHHLPRLRRTCQSKIEMDIDGSGLIAHLDNGKGDLAKDTALMTGVITHLQSRASKRRRTDDHPGLNTSPIFYETD
jgi:hypothetical protein